MTRKVNLSGQDPAEGSRETVEHDFERQETEPRKPHVPEAEQKSEPGSEAAEPSPE
jgi:hypothetical protein